MKNILISVLALTAAWSAQAAVETYKIDSTHSSVGFRVRHIVTKIPGEFTKFDGTLMVDRDNLEKSSVEAMIDVTSVNTRNEKRDNHLKSGDFFSVEKFPTMTFKSKAWKKTGENMFDVTGDLTIKDVTREVVLQTKLVGFSPGMKEGVTVSGWEGSTTLHRKDFGIIIPKLDKAVGEDVDVSIAIEATTQK